MRCSEDDLAVTLRRYTDLIVTLASASQVNVLTGGDTIPQGCAISTVSAKCEVHMMLKVGVVTDCMLIIGDFNDGCVFFIMNIIMNIICFPVISPIVISC